ncbi:Methionyl-tRNA formyltransferase [Bacteroidales bacterium Barb6]|nr:Methionyl-tRNA formyltransferase [Bacteroidales bacterium Barb6]
MKVKVWGSKDTAAFDAAVSLITDTGHKIIMDGESCDLAVTPLLTDILTGEELRKPLFGTLIFHPSPLPYGRGASAIRYAYRRNEPVTAATWFWADGGIDTGDICEQEIVKIDYGIRPREFYERDIIPAMLRTLKRALSDLSKGTIRKIPQVEKYATYGD